MRTHLKFMAVTLAGLLASPISAGATNLIGDVIYGSYDFPCDSCIYSDFSYEINPFTVDAAIETSLVIGVDFATEVDFNASSLVLTVLSDITYNPAAFSGPEFYVFSGNPFGNVVSVSSPAGEPVAAYVSGGVLYVNWQGDSFKADDEITISFAAPEAPSWAMMGLGFACLAFAASRRQRVSVS